MNAITAIQPYWHAGTWVFDDPTTGLVKEPFVAGMDEIFTRLTAHIPNARDGFVCLFSDTPFPGVNEVLQRREPEYGGTWYYAANTRHRGWLCPALFKYFPVAPTHIYLLVRAANG